MARHCGKFLRLFFQKETARPPRVRWSVSAETETPIASESATKGEFRRRRKRGTHKWGFPLLTSPQRKSKSFAAFLWQKEAQRKAKKRNAVLGGSASPLRKPFEKGLTENFPLCPAVTSPIYLYKQTENERGRLQGNVFAARS